MKISRLVGLKNDEKAQYLSVIVLSKFETSIGRKFSPDYELIRYSFLLKTTFNIEYVIIK